MQLTPLQTQACTGTKTHLVQLFDSDESLADVVADFFGTGLMLGETMLAVIDEERWYAVAMRMSARGLPVDEALRFGYLMLQNPRVILNRFMRRGRPNPGLFAASVGTLISELRRFCRPVRIYGEMVDVLAARGEYTMAGELEELWNELGKRQAFTLFCGYSAAHFGDPKDADALRRICAAHSEVLTNPADVLGSFLVRRQRVS
jgi:DcmR-like sensory protein